jgi:hypothetical protein
MITTEIEDSETTIAFMLSANFSITGRRKLSIKTANLDQHGIREPITSAQQHSRTKGHTESIRQVITGF